MLPKAKLKTLANGARIITAPIPRSEVITIMIGINVGTRAERKNQRGISHLVEHQVFKGSRMFASPIELNEALASIGAYYNASTNMEYTMYGLTCPKKNADEALEIISDIVLHPRIPEKEFIREKRVVFEESMIAHQSDDHYIEILFEDLMYQHQPLGWDILGTVRTVRAMNQQHVRRFIKKWYTGRRMAVAVIGGGDVEAITKKTARLFSKVPKGDEKKWKPFKRVPEKYRSKHLYRNDQLTTMMYGLPGVSFKSADCMPEEIVNQVFGGSTSSRLYNRIREERGLVYDVGSRAQYYSDAGHILITTSTKTTRAEAVLGLIREECDRIVTDKITREEFEVAKEVLQGAIAMVPENQEVLAVHYLNNLFAMNKVVQLGGMRTTINRASLTSVNRLAQTLFKDTPRYLVSIGGRDPLK